jgi:hypothetical protein
VEEGVVDKVRAAGGEVFAVTSEPQRLADQAHEYWELSFENVGDPHQEISKTCSEQGWLTLYANRGNLDFLQGGADWEIEHPKGFFQPGVLALTKEHRVLYRWRSVPSSANLNGTAMRPTAAHVWASSEQALAVGDSADDALHDDSPVVDQRPPPRIIFFAAIIANGWFVKPKSFMYAPGMESIPKRFKKAISRWVLFFFFWIVALVALPVGWVGVSFAVWFAWITIKLKNTMKEMNQQVELTAR